MDTTTNKTPTATTTAPKPAPAAREDRIRLACEICRSRTYTADLDYPAFITLQVGGYDFESASVAARQATAALIAVSLPASRATPVRSVGVAWFATITVRVGA